MYALWSRRPLFVAAAFVVVLTSWRLAALATSDLDLFFDEAQYWFWSTNPDFGYFSKPPVIAWLIAGGTALFGDTEFAVRVFSPLLYALTAALSAGIAAMVYDRKAAAWTAMTLATLPAVSLSAQLASTDVPLLLCWAAALLCWLRYWRYGGLWWLGFGIAFGVGLMSKYAMAYFLLCLPIALMLVPETRSVLRRPGLWLGLTLGFLLFLPNVWWNWTNELASFSHTADNANWSGPLLKPNKLGEFAGAQFGIMGPILLTVFLWALLRWRRLEPAERVLAAFAAPVLALMLLQALISRAHANWAAVAYVSATVLVVGWLLRQRREHWLGISLALHLVVVAVVLHGTGWVQLVGVDPWHRMRGWQEMGATVAERLAERDGALLMVRDRAGMAALLFYVPPQPPAWIKLRDGQAAGDHYELVSDPAAIGERPVLYLSRWGSADEAPSSIANRFMRVTPGLPISRQRPTRPPEVYNTFWLEGFKE